MCAFYCWLDFIKHFTDAEEFNPGGKQCSVQLDKIVYLLHLTEPVNQAGDTVLSIACTQGHISVISYFVEHKAWKLDSEFTVPCNVCAYILLNYL